LGGEEIMSHFAVAVFQEPKGKTLEQLLAPYQENNMGDCPKEYLEFNCVEDEYRKEFEEDGVEMVKMPDGRLLYPWNEEFRIPGTIGTGSDTHKVPEHLEIVIVKHKDRYQDFDTFMKDWAGCNEKDSETGKYGYWENPNKKWDWWQVGGRYSDRLMLRNSGSKVDSAIVKDIDFDEMTQVQVKMRENLWREAEGEDDATRYFKYGIEKNMTYEQYIKQAQSFTTFAVIMPDGKWYEKGQMGWWACVSNEEAEWGEKYKERFLDTAKPEWTLTIVDCHI
jgi:hypothetical protein